VIDGGLTKVVPAVVSWLGGRTRAWQSGDVQRYLVYVVIGAASLMFLPTWWLPYRSVQLYPKQEGRKVTLDMGQGKVPDGRIVFSIDWGDGKREENLRFTKNHIHEYQNPGQYKIVVHAHDPIWRFGKSSDDWFFGSCHFTARLLGANCQPPVIRVE
jgi:hypothetical protein